MCRQQRAKEAKWHGEGRCAYRWLLQQPVSAFDQLQLKSINFSPDSALDGELGKKNETKIKELVGEKSR
ncbi:hypothetical protein CEXT_492701 [Caerostris extrusa]|uniref:Uncharacterized protein n=1 Tax=Caerostris extrusa TaxID=172846 RepID=A0AAV4MHH7_CAEEX|nr:hypothetical protein CEXT_492701 [Caerostris extrusa]